MWAVWRCKALWLCGIVWGLAQANQILCGVSQCLMCLWLCMWS